MNPDELNKVQELIASLEMEPKAQMFLEPVDWEGLGLLDYPKLITSPMDISSVKRNLSAGEYFDPKEALNDIQLIWSNCKTYNIENSEIYKFATYCEKLTKRLADKFFKGKNTNKQKPQKSKTETKLLQKKTKRVGTTQPQIDDTSKEEVTESKNQLMEEGELQKDQERTLKEETNHNNKERENTKVAAAEENSNELTLKEKLHLSERVKLLSNDCLASLVRFVQKEKGDAIEDLDSEKLQIKLRMLDKKIYANMNQLIDTFLKVKETNQENLSNKRQKNY